MRVMFCSVPDVPSRIPALVPGGARHGIAVRKMISSQFFPDSRVRSGGDGIPEDSAGSFVLF